MQVVDKEILKITSKTKDRITYGFLNFDKDAPIFKLEIRKHPAEDYWTPILAIRIESKHTGFYRYKFYESYEQHLDTIPKGTRSKIDYVVKIINDYFSENSRYRDIIRYMFDKEEG